MWKGSIINKQSYINLDLHCFSGYDGTVRFWNLPNRIHQFLQHTCIFNRGEDISGEDLDGHLLGNVCWSSTGKLLAGSMDSLVNIWTTGGKTYTFKETATIYSANMVESGVKHYIPNHLKKTLNNLIYAYHQSQPQTPLCKPKKDYYKNLNFG